MLMQSLLSRHLRMQMQAPGRDCSAPVTFAVRNSTMHVIYEVRVIRFVDMTSGQVLHVVVLHIWQGMTGAILISDIIGIRNTRASTNAHRLPHRAEWALLF